VALGDIRLDGLNETAALLDNKSLRATLHSMDVSDAAQMEKFATEVLAQHGTVDILINNAGIGFTPRPFLEFDEALFRKVMEVNLWGVYHGVRAFLPYLKARPEASIVTVSSLGGLIGLSGYGPYVMSKFAVSGLSELLAMENVGTGLHVMSVHPGGVKTDLIRNAPDLAESERENAHRNFTRFALSTPDYVAARILNGIRRRRPRLIVGTDAKVVYALRQLFPAFYLQMLNAMFGRATFK
jgi:NAD(P)-dependent dehydrogenase (short-subunit alcohol dehydrogenase family)